MSKLENESQLQEQEVVAESSLTQFKQWLLQFFGKETSETPQPPFSLTLFGKVYSRLPLGTKKIIHYVEKRLADPHRYYEQDLVKRNVEEIVHTIEFYVARLGNREGLERLYQMAVFEQGSLVIYTPDIMSQTEAVKVVSAALELLRTKQTPYLSESISERQYLFQPTTDQEDVHKIVILSATESTPAFTLLVNFFKSSWGDKKAKFSLKIGDTLNHDFQQRKEAEDDASVSKKVELYANLLQEGFLNEMLFGNLERDDITLHTTKLKDLAAQVFLHYYADMLDQIENGYPEINSKEQDYKNYVKETELTVFIEKLVAKLPTLHVESIGRKKKAPSVLARLEDAQQRFMVTFFLTDYQSLRMVMTFKKEFIIQKQREAQQWLEEHYPQLLNQVRIQKAERGKIDVEEEFEQAFLNLINSQEWGENQKDVYLRWGAEFLEGKVEELLQKSIE